MSRSTQPAKEVADVGDDRMWLFPRREVPAAVVVPELLEVVVALRPAARGSADLLRQDGNPDRSLDDGHAVMQWRPGMVRGFVVVPRRRAVALCDPVDHDGGQQVVLAETGLDIAVAIAPAAMLFDDPR